MIKIASKSFRAAVVLLTLAVVGLVGCTMTTSPVTGSGSTLPLSIETISLPTATVGVAYSSAVLAQNGTAPYTFVLTSGTLPAGLTLAANGVVNGTPTAVASSSFTVTVTDASAETASATIGVKVQVGSATPVSISTTALSNATVGTAYSATIVAINGTQPYSFTVTMGALPTGLALSTGGVISGTPTTSGLVGFTVTVADATGAKATASFGLTVNVGAAVLGITTASLPAGTVGVAYSGQLAAANGSAPYSYAVTAGALPLGLTMSAGGAITGSPTTAGPVSFTVTVTDAAAHTANASFTVTIAAGVSSPVITTLSLPAGTVGTPYSLQLTVAGGTAPYSFAQTGGAIPNGLTLSTGGLLSGTPVGVVATSLTITVTDANGKTGSASLLISVLVAGSSVVVTPMTLPSGQAGVAYSAQFTASGGTGPYTFSVTGSTPAGLAFTTAGALFGSAITPGTSNFTVTATDANNQRGSANFSIVINPGAPYTVTITTTALPTALLSTNYTQQIGIEYGTAPYTVTVIGGSLPNGLSISSSGLITGVATTAGKFYFTMQVTDASSPVETTSATFELDAATVSATVLVDASAVLTTVPTNFYGLHTSVYDTSLSDSGVLPGLLADTGITTLRYPGGGYSDNYHWAQFSITPFYSSTSPACYIQADGYMASDGDFGTFARLLKASGTQGMITVNYGTSVADALGSKTTGTDGQHDCSEPNTYGQPQEAAAWVAYANGSASNTQVIGLDSTGFDWKTVGYWAALRAASPLPVDDGYNFLRLGFTAPLAIPYWEIGNEMYYNGWSTNHNAETDNHAPYIYPAGYTPGGFNSRDQLAALSPTAYGTNAVAFIQAMKAVDPTIQIGVDFSAPISTDPIPETWNPQLAQAVCAGANIDFAIMHYYPGTYLAVQPAELLSRPQADIPNVYADIEGDLAQYCPANASAIQVFLTETSPNGPLASGFPAPVVGLFTLNDYLTAMRTGVANIEWLEMHNGTYLTESEVEGPSFYGIELAHLMAAPGDKVLSTNTSSPMVVSWASLKANGSKGVVLLNADGSNPAVVQVTVSGATVGSFATEYSYGLTTTQSGSVLSGTTVPIAGATFTVTVPAYTAVELNIP